MQDIKACARAAGFTGNTSQGTLLTYMSIKPEQGLVLMEEAEAIRDEAYAASDSVGTLHFSDWVLFEDNHLGFFTIYDGDFEKYIQDFAEKTSLAFDTVFPHVVGAPPTPVAKNAQAFYQWALDEQPSAHRVLQRLPGPRGARHSSPARRSRITIDDHLMARDSLVTESALDLADIQGFVLRGYAMPMVRHFLLTVGAPAQARRQLGRLVSGDESDVPQITTAEDWHVGFAPGPGDDLADAPRRTPDYCLNIGITWPGLVALEIEERVPTLSFESFGVFIEGAAQRAELVGDTGASSPRNWIGGFGSGDDHVLVTLHAISPEAMTRYSDRLCAWFAEGDAFRELWRQDGMALMELQDGQLVPTAKVHFGYTDAITTPTIRGGPENYPLDHQEPCEPWLFVLREDAANYVVPEPRALGLNGSFAVFKKVEADVVGFEDVPAVEQGQDRS